MDIGQRIKEARQTAGLTQGELAKRVGVGLRTVGNWERGESSPERALPRLRLILKIDPEETVGSSGLAEATDVELLAELLQRATRRQRRAEDSVDMESSTRVGADPADLAEAADSDDDQDV